MNNIKRTIRATCVCFIVLASAILHATEVAENEILLAARKWIEGNAVFQAELPDAVPEKAMKMADFEGKTMPLWRVDLKPTGYLIMSADDTLPPVVAFNTNGAFDMPAAHPLPAMLNRQGEIFQEELDKPQTRGNELAAENQSRWNGLLGRTRAESTTPSKIITGPLVTTIWDQSAPYDYICPTDGRYLHRGITGCAPTAFAQILKWHEWPPRGQGNISHTDDQGNVKGELQADYSFPYEWDLMRDDHTDNWHNYKFDYPERTINRSDWAIARMMMEMGACARVDYEEDSTGGYVYYFQFLITSNLWYKDTVFYGDSRSQYTGYVPQETLYARIREDMVAGRPAILTYPGHGFVGDGLGTMGGLDYYHINYGWSGYHNGWYLLTDGYRSTVIVSATTGIEPRPVAMFKPMSVEQPAALATRPEQILHRDHYTVSYNAETMQPNWVAWRLTKAHTYGNSPRPQNAFREDEEVPQPRATLADYRSRKWSRGHMCPAGDNKWDSEAMYETFLLSNICQYWKRKRSGYCRTSIF